MADRMAELLSNATGLEAYEPTVRDRVRYGTMGMLEWLGMDPQEARRLASDVAGSPVDPNQGAFGVGLAELVPGLGTAMDLNDASRAAEQGRYLDAVLHGAGAGFGLADDVATAAALAARNGGDIGAYLARFAGDEEGSFPATGHNGGPRLTLDDIMSDDYRYSPSLLAATKLKQEKGTYEQMRAQLLKLGAKPDELAFSGFDKEFSGRSGPITRAEIEDYLNNNARLIGTQDRLSTGTLGGETSGMDDHDIMERYVDLNEDSEVEYLTNEWLPEMFEADAVYARDMDTDELISLAEDLGEDVDAPGFDPVAWAERYPDAVRYGDQAYTDANEALQDAAEGYDLSTMARESLWEQARNEDIDEVRRWIGEDPADPFDAGDTEYSQYFTRGGQDYQERTFHFLDPAGLDTRASPSATSHFSFSGDPSLYGGSDVTRAPLLHTRSAMFDDGSTYHLGEIQSDWAQRARGSTVATPEQEIAGGGFNELEIESRLRMLNDKAAVELADLRRGDIPGFEDGYPVDPFLLQGRPPTLAHAMPGSTPDTDPSMFVTEHTLSGYGPANRFMVWGDETPPLPGFPYATQHTQTPTRPPRAWEIDPTPHRDTFEYESPALQYLDRNRPMPTGPEYLPGFGDGAVQAVSRDFFGHNDATLANLLSAREQAQATKGTVPVGPYTRTTDKWVQAAFRDALSDAVQKGAKRFTFGSGDMATDMTMGSHSGQSAFYDEIVPKVVNKELKQYGTQLSPMTLQTGDGPRSTLGFDLTPDMVAAIKKYGIPYFAAAPGGIALNEILANSDHQTDTDTGFRF